MAAAAVNDNLQSTVTVNDGNIAQFRCLWIIPDYAQVKENIQPNEFIDSKQTVSVILQKFIYRLRLYPKGDSGASAKKSSLYVITEGLPSDKAWVCLKFAIIDGDTNEKYVYTERNATLIGPEGNTGCRHFFPTDFPTDDIKTLLPNGALQISVEGVLWTHEPAQKSKNFLVMLRDSKMSSISSLLKSATESDVTVAIDEQKIHFHESILASRSAVFKDILETENVIAIPNTTVEVFKELAHYMYTDTVTAMLDTMLPEVLILTHTYKLDFLKEICETKMVAKLCVANVIEYLRISNEYSAVELKSKCMDFIIQNIKEISQLESWNVFKSEHTLLGELLEIGLLKE